MALPVFTRPPGRRQRTHLAAVAASVMLAAASVVTFSGPAFGAPTDADLNVTVTDSDDPVTLGGKFTYTATVTNAGPAAATGISADVTTSGAAHTIVSIIAKHGDCVAVGANNFLCFLDDLANGASTTVTIKVEPSETGIITAAVTASASQTDPDNANNTGSESTAITNGLDCTITGTSGSDTLTGTSGDDIICGLSGNDTIYGSDGDDTIDGGNDDDMLYGGDGNDIMGGGNGNDYLYGEAGNDSNYGETLLGSLLYLFDAGDDHIYGGPGNDKLDGQKGDDILIDNDGTDNMSGGAGNDSINVQDGTAGDTANGGLGSDTCTTDTGDTRISC